MFKLYYVNAQRHSVDSTDINRNIEMPIDWSEADSLEEAQEQACDFIRSGWSQVTIMTAIELSLLSEPSKSIH